jgi:hypothetical protein
MATASPNGAHLDSPSRASLTAHASPTGHGAHGGHGAHTTNAAHAAHAAINAKTLFASREAAARKLQRAFRAKKARDAIKKMVRENYVKIFDKFGNKYVYKNRNTKEVFHTKPKFLGTDDLPNPKYFEAPIEYDANDDYPMDGYALLVTVNKFPSGKMAELPEATDSDHVLLEKVLTHDYICKFRQENVIVLKQPSCLEFMEAMNRLRRIVKRKGYFVMYLCSHVVTVYNGDQKNKSENGYICMKDTLWTKPRMIAKTAISLSTLVTCLSKLDCKFKTVFLNYAHAPLNHRSLFSSKILYPPGNFATRLANEAHCAVVTNCTTGTSLRDLVNHTAASTVLPRVYANKAQSREQRGWKKNYFTKQELTEFKNDEKEDDGGSAPGLVKSARRSTKKGTGVVSFFTKLTRSSKSDKPESTSKKPSGAIFPSNKLGDAKSMDVGMGRPATLVPSLDLVHAARNSQGDGASIYEPEPCGATHEVPFEEMFQQFVNDWEMTLESEDVYVTPMPELPDANWYRDDADADAIKVELPGRKDVSFNYCLYIFGVLYRVSA